jgi:hypothetical protein
VWFQVNKPFVVSVSVAPPRPILSCERCHPFYRIRVAAEFSVRASVAGVGVSHDVQNADLVRSWCSSCCYLKSTSIPDGDSGS